jgi:manganese/zinc/iron transport system substrate-binding protein
MRPRWIGILPAVLAAAMLAGACTGGNGDATGDTAAKADDGTGLLRVTATTGQVGDLVRVIGGDHVVVTELMGPGVDPHSYKPSETDVGAIRKSHVAFFNGLYLEGKLASTLEKLGESHPVIAVAEQLPADRLLAGEGDAESAHPDPHVWFDIGLWKLAAGIVRDKLTEMRPDKEADFNANHAAWVEAVDELDGWAKAEIATIPEARRIMITAHDAFRYFGRYFGVDVRGMQGISTATEPSPSKVRDLVTLLVEREVPAIFVESTIAPKNIEPLIKGAAAQGHTVVVGGELFSDAMGPDKTAGGTGTYIGMMRHNIRTLVDELKP